MAGIYDVKVGIRTNSDEGKFKLYINGASKAQGTEQDEYSAAVGYKVLDLGTVRFTTPLPNQMFNSRSPARIPLVVVIISPLITLT